MSANPRRIRVRRPWLGGPAESSKTGSDNRSVTRCPFGLHLGVVQIGAGGFFDVDQEVGVVGVRRTRLQPFRTLALLQGEDAAELSRHQQVDDACELRSGKRVRCVPGPSRNLSFAISYTRCAGSSCANCKRAGFPSTCVSAAISLGPPSPSECATIR